MSKRIPQPTQPARERAFLVGVDLRGHRNFLPLEDSLAELTLLADTAGLEVVGELTQKLDHPNVETYIGPGKVAELKALSEETLSQVILFDDELSPRHQRELEEALGPNARVLDRTALILDIFAQHAHTAEGMVQVELAQYEYLLPRLTGQWTHLARQAGGGGGRTGSGGVGLRGPGETQLEVDRRSIRNRIAHLKRELEKVRAHRMRYRSQRKRARIPTIALVGYTNAGKSTLLNRLTRSDVYVADQLFATLDPTTRRIELSGGYQALLTDTVGFIQKLPTTLVAAFHATLEEIAEADLLLHVVDISHPNALNQYQSVQKTLEEIGAGHIPTVTALNKIDRLVRPEVARETVRQYSKAVAISARKGIGLPDLLALIKKELYETYISILVRLPYQQGALISLFHEAGQVERIAHERGAVVMQGRIPGRLAAQFSPWQTTNHPAQSEAEEI
ncbi:MAG TPA: GTPase HflX [Anaerolineales bacterium]|nr:GTPase HflX [Anaerolineales bacterium]